MPRGRSRSGYTILALLVVIVIIGYLYSKQMGVHAKPAGGPDQKVVAKLPDEARNQAFHMVAQQVQQALVMAENEGKPKPMRWEDLGRMGIDTLRRDPWNGKYYLKDGYLRCTGNPKVWEKL